MSIVVPVYNRARLLPTALESIRRQTYRPIECLVVDDGSTDESVSVARAWEANSGSGLQFRLLSQPNMGACAARNHGLRESRGEFVGFLDSDDFLHPHAIASKVAILRSTGSPYCYDRGERVTEDGRPIGHFGQPWPSTGERLVSVYLFSTNAPLLRRQACIAVGPWDESLAGCQEVEYFSRLILLVGRGEFLDQIGYRVVEHGEPRIVGTAAHSAAALRVQAMILARLQGAGPAFAADRQELTMLLQTQHRLIAEASGRRGDYTRAREAMQEACRYGYRKLHARVFLKLSRTPIAPLVFPVYFAARRMFGRLYRGHDSIQRR